MPDEPAPAAGEVPRSERFIVFLVGAVQFVNILDFMMVMPLGPDFARALGISTAHLGVIAGSYTLTAALSGIIAANFLDRFDRRSALGVALFGLVTGTALGALAQGLASLVLARAVAGAFGGPAMAISLSIIADVVPPARRGRAMGAVMGAFSVASVLGVYVALQLATWGGWRLPFVVVAAMGVLVVLGALRAMPPMRGHIVTSAAGKPTSARMSDLLGDPTIRFSLAMNSLVMLTAFLVIPNIAPHLLQNLHLPRDPWLGRGYAIGGLASFLIMRAAGRAIDRYGAPRVSIVGTALMIGTLYFAFIAPGAVSIAGVMAVFVSFMGAMSLRNVSMQSLATRVPRADQRAGYMSLQSTAQFLASSAGAFVSSRMLHDAPNGRLEGIATVSMVSAVLALGLPPMLSILDRQVRAREQKA